MTMCSMLSVFITMWRLDGAANAIVLSCSLPPLSLVIRARNDRCSPAFAKAARIAASAAGSLGPMVSVGWTVAQAARRAAREPKAAIRAMGVMGGVRSVLQCREHFIQHLLGVAEQHAVVLLVEERIVDARIARGHAALHDDRGLRLPHFQ